MDKVKEYSTARASWSPAWPIVRGKYSIKQSLPEITACICTFSEAANDLLQGSNKQWFSRCDLGVSNICAMQILRPHPRATESETLFWSMLKLGTLLSISNSHCFRINKHVHEHDLTSFPTVLKKWSPLLNWARHDAVIQSYGGSDAGLLLLFSH